MVMAGGYGKVGEQKRAAHAISNPTLANIEKRWEAMPPQEQADLWMALRDRMKVNWGELTLQEKRAGELFTFPSLPERSSRGMSSCCLLLSFPVPSTRRYEDCEKD